MHSQKRLPKLAEFQLIILLNLQIQGTTCEYIWTTQAAGGQVHARSRIGLALRSLWGSPQALRRDSANGLGMPGGSNTLLGEWPQKKFEGGVPVN